MSTTKEILGKLIYTFFYCNITYSDHKNLGQMSILLSTGQLRYSQIFSLGASVLSLSWGASMYPSNLQALQVPSFSGPTLFRG